MPRVARELSAIEVKRLSHPGGKHPVAVAVGGVAGLHLQITPADAKSWLLRTTVAGKRREMGLGGYPTVTLATAREAAREALAAVRAGRDPIGERKAAREALAANAKRMTFAEAVDSYLATKVQEFRNAKHAAQWRSTLDTYAAPVIGATAVAEVDRAAVLRTLAPLWATKTETATRLRGRIEAVLAWATANGQRSGDNPARWKGNLDVDLPKPNKVANGGHHPALALADVGRWFADLEGRDGMAARALAFLALTVARSGEVRGATWAEIDLDGGVWTVPGSRMKAGREHRVPLTPEAVAVLRALPHREGLLFPGARGGPLSDMALSAVMRRQQESEVTAGRPGFLDPRSGRPAVPHGLRSTFRDWAAEKTKFPRELAELCLAHDVGSEVERAYRRSDMVERRRAVLAAWARVLRPGR